MSDTVVDSSVVTKWVLPPGPPRPSLILHPRCRNRRINRQHYHLVSGQFAIFNSQFSIFNS